MIRLSLIMLTTLLISTFSTPTFAAEKCGTVEGITSNNVFKGVTIRIENICFDGNKLTNPIQLSDLSGKSIAPEMTARSVEPLNDSNGTLVGFIFNYHWGFNQAVAYRFDPKSIRYGKISIITNRASRGQWGEWTDLTILNNLYYKFSKS